MYPFIRMGWQVFKHRNDDPLPLSGVHQSFHHCLRIDLDPWRELNNGRTLTLYDLGRIPLIKRNGMHKVLKEQGWGMTVAGVSVRYRRRVSLKVRFEMLSRIIGRDEKFFYFQQSMWRPDVPLSSILLRVAVIKKGAGIVATDTVLKQMGQPDWNPALPEWVHAWIKAEDRRIWPPEF